MVNITVLIYNILNTASNGTSFKQKKLFYNEQDRNAERLRSRLTCMHACDNQETAKELDFGIEM